MLYLGLLDLILALHAKPLDLVLQELMDALPDRLHGLADAGNPEVLIRAGDQQALGN